MEPCEDAPVPLETQGERLLVVLDPFDAVVCCRRWLASC